VLQSLELGALEKYNRAAVESSWYDWWVKEGFFKPQLTKDGQIKPEGKFILILPPPNVTGSLHIGHALTAAIQDTLVRWYCAFPLN
jgi:valyl-tRNA synthetase